VVPPGGSRVEAIFVLAGTSLGIGRVERAASPVWLNLDDLVNLDALGDPIDGLTEIEITMDDRRVIGAGWPAEFCDAVVEQLLASSGAATATPGSPAAARRPEPPTASDTPSTSFDHTDPDRFARVTLSAEPDDMAPTVDRTAPLVDVAPLGDVAPAPAAPASVAAPIVDTTGSTEGSPALELEDVVYLSGYPGQTKRRKKCTVRMSREALELDGPGDMHFRVGWDVVRTIEVQNSDEARFRMNTKVHRDASALVIACDQDVSILLEARDCPTIALRSAMSQLLAGLAVVVV